MAVFSSPGVPAERTIADGSVEVTGGVAEKRAKSVGRVLIPGSVVSQRFLTSGRVKTARRVAIERSHADCRVGVSGVEKERPSADRRAELAFCIGSERPKPNCRFECGGGKVKEGGKRPPPVSDPFSDTESAEPLA